MTTLDPAVIAVELLRLRAQGLHDAADQMEALVARVQLGGELITDWTKRCLDLHETYTAMSLSAETAEAALAAERQKSSNAVVAPDIDEALKWAAAARGASGQLCEEGVRPGDAKNRALFYSFLKCSVPTLASHIENLAAALAAEREARQRAEVEAVDAALERVATWHDERANDDRQERNKQEPQGRLFLTFAISEMTHVESAEAIRAMKKSAALAPKPPVSP